MYTLIKRYEISQELVPTPLTRVFGGLDLRASYAHIRLFYILEGEARDPGPLHSPSPSECPLQRCSYYCFGYFVSIDVSPA